MFGSLALLDQVFENKDAIALAVCDFRLNFRHFWLLMSALRWLDGARSRSHLPNALET